MRFKFEEIKVFVNKNGHSFGIDRNNSPEKLKFKLVKNSVNELISISKSAYFIWDKCENCGEYLKLSNEYLSYEKVPGSIEVLNPCNSVKGSISEAEVSFPSGEIIIDDDLRPIFEVPFKYGDFDLNSNKGQKKYIEAYSEINCAYGPVLNTCPNVYKVSETEYVIASLPLDDEDEEVIPENWGKVANVCTDLWAYSIADYQEWKDKGGETIENKNRLGDRQIVSVKPGKYKSTHYTTLNDFDWDAETVIYGKLEWISD